MVSFLRINDSEVVLENGLKVFFIIDLSARFYIRIANVDVP